MAKKSVNDPESLGWTDDGNGFWSWSGGGSGGGDDIWFRNAFIGPDQTLVSHLYCLADRSTTDPTFHYRLDPDQVILKVDKVQSTEYVDENNNSIIGSGGSSLWEQNGNDIYYNDGNVGVGTDDPKALLHSNGVDGELARFQGVSAQLRMYSDADGFFTLDNVANGKFKIRGAGADRLTIDDAGNVGVGTDPAVQLHVKGSEVRIDNTGSGSNGYIRFMNDSGAMSVGMSGASANELLTYDRLNGQNASRFVGGASGFWEFFTNGTARLTIDAAGNVLMPDGYLEHKGKIYTVAADTSYVEMDATTGTALIRGKQGGVGGYSYILESSTGNATFYGNVGIGMKPEVVTFDLSAKEQLKEWKTKAKKASWPIVTDGAFEQEPTEDLVAKWIETRGAGDRLQVAGRISSTGNMIAPAFSGGTGLAGIRAGSLAITPMLNDTSETDAVSMGSSGFKWKDGWFSDTVNAKDAHFEGISTYDFGAIYIENTAADPSVSDSLRINSGGKAQIQLKGGGDATFTGTVNAGNHFTVTRAGGSYGWRMGEKADDAWYLSDAGFTKVMLSVAKTTGDATFSGTVTDSTGRLAGVSHLIQTLSTLRAATQDETTLEGLRDSIGNAIGGLIEKFEAEIAAIPAPETGTMETLQ